MGRQKSFYPTNDVDFKGHRRASAGTGAESANRYEFYDGTSGEITFIDENEEDRCPSDEEPDAWNVKVAAGKAFGILDRREEVQLSIERTSVYGAAFIMPQLARTAKGSLSFMSLAIRSYFLLVLNLLLQGFLLYMISKEQRIMDKFAGEPHICDFGAGIEKCPDGPNCKGPGGSYQSPDRLYDWTVWSTRDFVKQTFLAMFPERADEINEKIDPGEFGVESYYLRIASVGTFVLGLYPDLAATLELAHLLWHVPSKAEPWMYYDPPVFQEKVERAPGWSELDNVKFKIAGMSRTWKVVNIVCVWFPKIYIWLLMVDVGTVFLMETSKIEDMIINSATLAFILNIDELICVSIMPAMCSHMMDAIEDYSLEDDEADTFWNRDAVLKHEEDLNWNFHSPSFYARVFPRRLVAIVSTTIFFIAKYYYEGCRREPDGSMVSEDVQMPNTDTLPLLSFLLGPFPGIFPVDVSSETLWRMPSATRTPAKMWTGG